MLRESLSSTLSSLPEQFHADREELLAQLRSHGILYQSAVQPVLSRDGTSARWMLDSLSVTLTSRGGELASRCILELLKRFDGKQIATYGLTAVPILQSCVTRSNGKYRGLLVRKERKKHGSLKLIEGPLDPDEPIILIDDSVSSGTSAVEACELLEQAGLRVEGGVFMVRFGWYGGYALLQERGYHVEAVSDIWDDFMKYMEDEELPLANPSKWFPAFEWSASRAPDGLHPATLARLAIAEYLSSGKLLRAPERLDAEYDSAGGAWVSIRSRTDVHHRYARDGFWHFPDEACNSASEDVMLASFRAALELPAGQEGLKILGQSGIAVTFFTALQRCTVGQLDNDRYGIVVRSLERPSTMGGALPRMPGIRNEWEQFQHARRKNGQLISFEPFEIFRHDLVKAVEPQTNWQPTGVPVHEARPWYRTESICGRIAQRARDFVVSRLFDVREVTDSLPDDLIPDDVDSIYVTIYLSGRLSGCMGSRVRNLDETLQGLATAALEDDRFGSQRPNSPASVAVSASILFNPLELGEAAADEIQPYYKCGQQALMVYRGEQLGLLLPFVAATYNLDSERFAQAVVEKSGLTEGPYYWCRLDTVTWLADEDQTVELFCGFPDVVTHVAGEQLAQYANWHSDYLVRHQRTDGSFHSTYEPCQDQLSDEHTLSRSAHAAWVAARGYKLLARRDLLTVADEALEPIMPGLIESEDGCWLGEGESASVSEIAFLALALCSLPDNNRHRPMIDSLARTLWSAASQPHGRIKTHRDSGADEDLFQDYFPGQALLALAVLSEVEPAHVDLEAVQRCFKYYRHRFRYRRHFGQCSWLMQAFARWWQVTRDSCFAEFVFEIGDWILTYQQEKTGGFINDHQPDSPGYTTAVYLEGIAAVLRLADSLGDVERFRKYQSSFMEGFRFLDRLILQPCDASLLPNFELACGGVRESLYSSRVRLDFVQHSLSAILEYVDAGHTDEFNLMKIASVDSTSSHIHPVSTG